MKNVLFVCRKYGYVKLSFLYLVHLMKMMTLVRMQTPQRMTKMMMQKMKKQKATMSQDKSRIIVMKKRKKRKRLNQSHDNKAYLIYGLVYYKDWQHFFNNSYIT